MKIQYVVTTIIVAPAFAWIFFWLAILNREKALELSRAVEDLSTGKYSIKPNRLD
jgi:hypothetical protein